MKRVVVIASGNTERHAIPHLVAHLANDSIQAQKIRVPPRNGPLTIRTAEKLIKGA